MEYYAGDGLPLRVGDVVTCAPGVSDYKHAHYLIEGTVVENCFGYKECGEYICHVTFEQSADSYRRGSTCACLMKHLVHLSTPSFNETEFFTMLEVSR